MCFPVIPTCQDSLASLARRIRVCFSRQIPVRIRAHPRGAFNSVGACTPTELNFKVETGSGLCIGAYHTVCNRYVLGMYGVALKGILVGKYAVQHKVSVG